MYLKRSLYRKIENDEIDQKLWNCYSHTLYPTWSYQELTNEIPNDNNSNSDSNINSNSLVRNLENELNNESNENDGQEYKCIDVEELFPAAAADDDDDDHSNYFLLDNVMNNDMNFSNIQNNSSSIDTFYRFLLKKNNNKCNGMDEMKREHELNRILDLLDENAATSMNNDNGNNNSSNHHYPTTKDKIEASIEHILSNRDNVNDSIDSCPIISDILNHCDNENLTDLIEYHEFQLKLVDERLYSTKLNKLDDSLNALEQANTTRVYAETLHRQVAVMRDNLLDLRRNPTILRLTNLNQMIHSKRELLQFQDILINIAHVLESKLLYTTHINSLQHRVRYGLQFIQSIDAIKKPFQGADCLSSLVDLAGSLKSELQELVANEGREIVGGLVYDEERLDVVFRCSNLLSIDLQELVEQLFCGLVDSVTSLAINNSSEDDSSSVMRFLSILDHMEASLVLYDHLLSYQPDSIDTVVNVFQCRYLEYLHIVKQLIQNFINSVLCGEVKYLEIVLGRTQNLVDVIERHSQVASPNQNGLKIVLRLDVFFDHNMRVLEESYVYDIETTLMKETWDLVQYTEYSIANPGLKVTKSQRIIINIVNESLGLLRALKSRKFPIAVSEVVTVEQKLTSILKVCLDIYNCAVLRYCSGTFENEQVLLSTFTSINDDFKQRFAERFNEYLRFELSTKVIISIAANSCKRLEGETSEIAKYFQLVRSEHSDFLVEFDKCVPKFNDPNAPSPRLNNNVSPKRLSSNNTSVRKGVTSILSPLILLERRMCAAFSLFCYEELLHCAISISNNDLKMFLDNILSSSLNTERIKLIVPRLQCLISLRHTDPHLTLMSIIDANWVTSNLATVANYYVDDLFSRLKPFVLGIESSPKRETLQRVKIHFSLIETCYKVLFEGFTSVNQCSTEGRAAMSLDLMSFYDMCSTMIQDLEYSEPEKTYYDELKEWNTVCMSFIDKWIRSFYYPYQERFMFLLEPAVPLKKDESSFCFSNQNNNEQSFPKNFEEYKIKHALCTLIVENVSDNSRQILPQQLIWDVVNLYSVNQL